MKSTKDTLIREFLERLDGKVLAQQQYRLALRDMIRGHAGVYALYKNESLYYVGLASNLMGRVNHHLKDRHAGKWTRFSVYLTSNGDHIKPIESLLLRIAKPRGNSVQGRITGARDLMKTLRHKVSDQQKDEQARLLGGALARKRRRQKTTAAKGTLVLAGSMDRRLALRADYKGKRYAATLRKDGQVSYGGELYASPSGAAKAVVGRAANGWQFWRYKKGAAWVPLAELRK